MPTNLLRRKPDQPTSAQKPAANGGRGQSRFARLTVGRRHVILRLLETRTADLVWRALPLFSIAET